MNPLIKIGVAVAAALFIVIGLTVFWPLASVPAGYMGVVTLFGRVSPQPLEPGLHLINPMAHIINMDVRQYPLKIEGEVGTKDLQSIHGVLVINYAAVPSKVAELYQRFGKDWHLVIIAPAAADRMKAVTPHFNAEEMVTKREQVRGQMRSAVIEAVNARSEGMVIIKDVVVENLEFAKSFKKAIEEKQVAEQNALRAERDLQRIKVEADQKRAQAQGIADALVMQAKAESEAFKLKSVTITPQMLQMSSIEKWDGKLPVYLGSGAPVPFLSVK